MIALVIGATGATGRPLVEKLLAEKQIESVIQFVRNGSNIVHEKLVTHVVDFDKIQEWKDFVKGDMAFSALGTTLKDAGSKEAQYKVDYTYQLQFAQVAKANGVRQFVLLSAMGADANSAIFYSRMKGELENAIKALDFEQLSIFKPGALLRPNSTRKGEKLGVKFINFLNKLGIGKKYKPLPTADLAQAMICQALQQKEKIEIIVLEQIWRYIA